MCRTDCQIGIENSTCKNGMCSTPKRSVPCKTYMSSKRRSAVAETCKSDWATRMLILLLLLLNTVCTPLNAQYGQAVHLNSIAVLNLRKATADSPPVPAASTGYNGGPGSVGGNAYAAPSYDPYAQSQHAYGAAAMQPAAPSSPYRQPAGGFGGGGGGGFGSTMAASNPYASSAAPVPGRSPVGGHGLCNSVCACVCVCVCVHA